MGTGPNAMFDETRRLHALSRKVDSERYGDVSTVEAMRSRQSAICDHRH